MDGWTFKMMQVTDCTVALVILSNTLALDILFLSYHRTDALTDTLMETDPSPFTLITDVVPLL